MRNKNKKSLKKPFLSSPKKLYKLLAKNLFRLAVFLLIVSYLYAPFENFGANRFSKLAEWRGKLFISTKPAFGATGLITLIGTPQVGSANNGGTVSLTFSTRPSENDVTIVCAASPAATPAASTAPTEGGYQILKTFTGTGNTQPSMACWYKVQGATTDTTATSQGDGAATTDSTAIAFVLRGVNTSSVSDQTPTTAGVTTSTNPDPAQIITQTDGAWVVVVAASVQTIDTAVGTITGYTNYYQTGGNDTYDHTHAMATKEVATAGTENPGAWDAWTSGNWYAITMAIKPLVPPTVSTDSATGNVPNAARLNGTISATGGADATEHGFAWGIGPTLNNGDTSTSTLGAKTGAGAFYENVSPACGSGTYYFRAYATNSAGTGYGGILNFTAPSCPPAAPTRHDAPFRAIETPDQTPDFDFTASDPDGSASLDYQIIIDDNYNFSSPIVNCTSLSGGTCSTGAGSFVNTENGGDSAPFTEGQRVRFTPSTSFSNSADNTAYYWKINARDDSGTGGGGFWGATSTISTFRVNTGLANPRYVQTTDNQFSLNSFSGAKVDTGNHRIGLSIGGTNTYNYSGVAATDDYPNVYADDVDVFPFAGDQANRNSHSEAGDSVYGQIGSSDDDRWQIGSAGVQDEIFIWNEFNLSDDPAAISQIDFVFEGILQKTGNVSIYVLKDTAHASGWETDANWTQVGTSQSFTGLAESTITRSLTTNIADYIDADGDIIWGIYEDISNTWVEADYIKLDVTVSAPTNGYSLARPVDFSWVSGTGNWSELAWTEVETLGTVSTQLWYASSTAKGDPSDGAACDTPVPDADLPGNSSWFASGPVDLSDLDTTAYDRLCPRAKLTNVSGSPYLNDWTLTWAAAQPRAISGTLYSGEGSGPLDGKSIKVMVATSTPGLFSATTASGAWTVNDVYDLKAGVPIAAWWDGGGAGEKAYALTKATSSKSNISGLDLYQNRIILKHEATSATSTTIADLAFCDADSGCGGSGDSDIMFTANGGALSVNAGQELHVWTGKSFMPGGTVTLHGNQGSAPDGDFHLDNNASSTISAAFNLAGNWYSDAGTTFRPGSQTVTFTATTTGKTINGYLTSATSSFYNLTFGGSGGGWTFNNNASTTNNFTVNSGAAVTAPSLLSIGGSYANNGSFTANSGTVYLSGSAQQTLSGNMTNGSAFYNLTTLNNSGGGDAVNAPSIIFSANASTTATFAVGVNNATARFLADGLYTFTNISFNGAVGQPFKVRSSDSVTHVKWKLIVTGTQSVSYTDFMDTDASLGNNINAYNGTNINSGDNLNITFVLTVLTQAAYLFENTTSISTGDFDYPKGDSFSDRAAKNTALTDVKIGERMLLRINLENSGSSATTTFKLRFGTGAGCPDSCSWSDVTDTSAIALAPALLGELGNWSENVAYPKIATTTMGWSAGRYVIGTSTINTAPVAIGSGNSTELVFGLDTSRAATSTQYYFQVYNVDESKVLDFYNQYPSLTVVSSANDLKRYSKGVLNAAPSNSDASSSLPYFLDNEAYTNLTADDTGTSTVKLTGTAYEKLYSQFEVSGSKIYYTWQELDNTTNCSAAACNQIWLGASNLDGTGTTTAKLTNTGYHKYSPQLQIIGSKIYYAWYERDGADQRQVWLASSNLDGSGTTTAKLTNTAFNKYAPQFQIVGSKAYYAWTEVDAAAKQQIWLGASNLDGTGTTTVKLTNTAYIKYFPQFQVMGSKIYYTWYELDAGTKNQIWQASSNLDGTGTTTVQLTNTAFDKTYPQFQVVGSKIYYTWQELDNTTNCSAAACNQVWLASSNLDGTGTTTAKFNSKIYHQQGPQLQVIGSKVYYAWSEDAGGNYYQLWLASSNLDGVGTTTAKLTNSGNTKNGPQFQILGSKIYYSWFESDGSYNQIWLGIQTFGEKQEASESANFAAPTQLTNTASNKYASQLQVVGSKIYYIWEEYDTASQQCTSFSGATYCGQIWLGSSNLDGTATTTVKLTTTDYDKAHVQFQVVGSKIYYTWRQCESNWTDCLGPGNDEFQVWLGTSNLDGTGVTAVQLTTTAYNREYPQLQVVGSKIYYTWAGADETAYYQTWLASSRLDGSGIATVKLNSKEASTNVIRPQFQVVGSKIYYTWLYGTGIWFGSSNLDGTATTTVKLYSGDSNSGYPEFQVVDSKIYYTWRYNNQIWLGSSNLDGTGTTTVKLTSTAYNKYAPQFQIVGSKIYYTWYESDGSNNQIWSDSSNLDGTATTTTKLTSTAYSKNSPQFQIAGSKIYYTWYEYDGAKYQIWLGSNYGYNQFNFREKSPNGVPEEIAVTWNGQASITGATTPTVSLQIYNRNSSQWETLASSNTYTEDVDFTLSGSVTSNPADYLDGNYYAAFRVTQNQREQYLTTDYFSIVFRNPYLTQAAYLFENTTSISTGDFNYPKGDSFSDRAAKNTALTDVKIGERLLLRVNLENSGNGIATTTFKLRLGTGGGCPDSCSWSDVTDSSAISLAPAMLGEMGNWSEVEQTLGPDVAYPKIATTTMGWSVGKYVIGTSTIMTATTTIAVGNSSELVFGLTTTNAAASTQYYFQIYNAGKSKALDAYNQYPSFTIVSPANDLRRYSKGVLNAAPAAGDASSSLPYFLDNEAYANLTADDTGTSTVKLTGSGYDKNSPQFQVVGSKIYYTWYEPDTAAKNQIWHASSNLDGTGTTTAKLTSTAFNKYTPQFQIIGSKIYYTWYESDGSNNQIWQASSNLDGTGTTTAKLTNTAYDKGLPQFQIIGSKIYYTWFETDGAKYQIWHGSSNLDGTGITTAKLTNTAYNKYYPQFQVVGSKIYYTWEESDGVYQQIWSGSSNLDGTGTTTTKIIATSGEDNNNPQFQIVGSKIYYIWTGFDESLKQRIWLGSSNLDGTGTTTVLINSVTNTLTRDFPQLQVVGSKIFYTWHESDGSKNQIWHGTSNLDYTATTSSMLTSTAYSKISPQLQVVGSKIYYAWYECDDASSSCTTGKNQIQFGIQTFGEKQEASEPAAFNPAQLTATAYNKTSPQFQIVGSKIYYTWDEVDAGTKQQIWYGSSNLDGTGTTTAQLTSTAYNKYASQLQVVGSKIYYTWHEYDAGTYKQIWLGTSNLDGTGFIPTKLTSTAYIKEYPQLQVVGSKIYYTWDEYDGANYRQIWLASSNLDGTGTTTTQLTSTAYAKFYPQFQVAGSKIYYTWEEVGAYRQIWLASSNLDGTGFIPTKLTSTAYIKEYPQLQVVGSKIYYIWYEPDAGAKQQIWLGSSNLDGTGTTTVKLTSTAYSKYYPQFQVVGSKIYYTWYATSSGSTYYQIWQGTSNLDGTGTTTTQLTSTAYNKQYPQLQVVGSKIYYTWYEYDAGAKSQIWFGSNYGYNQFNFREKSSGPNQFSVAWNGQASITGATTPTVSLEIYNNTSSQWVSLASSNTYTAGADFSLSASVTTNLADYYDANYYLAFRVTQDQREQYLTTDYFSISGPFSLANHENGQLPNQFSGTSVTNKELFGFRLIPSTASLTVGQAVFQLEVRGFTQSDITSAALYIDYDGDKTKDPEDSVLDGAGSVSISGNRGTITFGSFSANAAYSYLLVASVANIKPGRELQISLPLYGITPASGGYTTPAWHYWSGGYGGGGSSIGDYNPTGTPTYGGTTPSAGEEIGSEPGFFAPTSTGSPLGQWTGGASAYASDGAYATAASAGLIQDFAEFSFNVPTSNTVEGIIVKIEASATGGGGSSIQFSLSYNGGSNYTAIKEITDLGSTDTIYTLGGSGDKWGEASWTVSQTSNVNFRLRAIAQPGGLKTVYLDAMQVKIYHVTGGGGGGGGGGEL